MIFNHLFRNKKSFAFFSYTVVEWPLTWIIINMRIWFVWGYLYLCLSLLSLSIFLFLSGLRHVIMYNLMNAVWQSYNGSSRSSRSLGLITTVWTNCLKNEAKAGITKIFVNDLIGLTVSHYDNPQNNGVTFLKRIASEIVWIHRTLGTYAKLFVNS